LDDKILAQRQMTKDEIEKLAKEISSLANQVKVSFVPDQSRISKLSKQASI
jgi:HAMP domain-containing protein